MPVSKSRRTEGTTTELVPYWRSECGRATVYVGNCREVMARMEPGQFHAVVTDPPYGLGKEPDVAEVMESWVKRGYHEVTGSGFMGKSWDCFVPQPATWHECVRVMKPGAHMVCFSGTRTLDWMGMSLRFVGLQCRDIIMYCYGGGYPKGRDISKAIDSELGVKRSKVRTPMGSESSPLMTNIGADRPWKEKAREAGYHEHDSDEPVTEEAKQWQGWNTTLKPALEPVILARRPLPDTVAKCVMEHGTGAINIDACRVGTTGTDVSWYVPSKQSYGSGIYGFNRAEAGTQSMNGETVKTQKDGRWPANLMHDGSEEVLALFPESSSSSSVMPLPNTPGDCIGQSHGTNGKRTLRGHDDEGSAARFFYTVKADDDDRPHGNKGTETVVHPTVKPLDLMRWLVRLVCPRGGLVLDPFMGSGSTGCAAIEEGMRFVGIELSQEYADIAVGRLRLSLAKVGAKSIPEVPASVRRAVGTAPPPSRMRRG